MSPTNTSRPTHELDSPPWLRVETTLMSTAGAIRQAYDQRLAAHGLTLSLASLLCYVDEFGPVNQTRAAEHLEQGRAVTGSQVDRLESLGYVRRCPQADDRRVWMLATTSAGSRAAATIAQVDEVLRSELRTGISRTDRQLLTSLLMRLQQNLHEALSPSTESSTEPPLGDKI